MSTRGSVSNIALSVKLQPSQGYKIDMEGLSPLLNESLK
jgi:hypothetical protein